MFNKQNGLLCGWQFPFLNYFVTTSASFPTNLNQSLLYLILVEQFYVRSTENQ